MRNPSTIDVYIVRKVVDMTEEDQTFVTRFKSYVQSVADSKAEAETVELRRAAMLAAFREFLIGASIGPDKVKHFEILAKMTDFAKGAGPGGPS
jgi:hypothetical protein